MTIKPFASLILLVLTGCVQTMPQQQFRPTAKDDPSNTCFQAIGADPRFEVLSPHLVVGRSDQHSVEMMASAKKPTEDERQALSAWGQARQSCANMGKAFRAQYAPPGWVSAYDMGQSSLLQAIAKLYGGDFTYGQFIMERQRIAGVTSAQLQDASGRDSAVRAQQAQQEAARADAALQMMLIQQQANRPVTTTCNRFMNQVNCTTR